MAALNATKLFLVVLEKKNTQDLMWKLGTKNKPRAQMSRIVSAKNLQDLQKWEPKLGTRFSVIAFLLYYDTIRMRAIDQRIISVLEQQNIFSKSGKIWVIWIKIN